MKKNKNKIFFFYVCLVLLIANTTLLCQTWETHTNKDDVQDLCCVGDYCWVATTGGVVKVNIHDFSFEEYDQDDWLPQNNVNTIFNYKKQMWLGYNGYGITIYDGINEFTYNTNNSGLVSNSITCFAVDTLNRIWIGTKGGASVFDGETWENYNTDNSEILDDNIYSIAVGRNNKIWFGTYAGLSVFDGQNWQSFTKTNSVLQGSLICDLDFEYDNLWMAAFKAGVYCYQNGRWRNYNMDNCAFLNNYIRTVFVDSKKNKWFGSVYGRVYCYSYGVWTVFDSTNSVLPVDLKNIHGNIISTPVIEISEDKNGNMWIGTKMGLYFYNGTGWKKITISGELPSNYITAIANDRKNQKWYGTIKGVSVDKNGEWQIFNTLNSNMQSDMINAIAADSSGNVWIATGNKGAAMYDGDTLRDLKSMGCWPPMYTILSIAADKDGTVWVGGLSRVGIFEYHDSTFTSHIVPELSYTSTPVVDIGIDMYNNKWICTSEMDHYIAYDDYGAGRFDGSDWQFFNPENSGIASISVEAVAVENNGRLWFGTAKGVSTFDGENWQTYNTDNSGLIQNYITSVTIDKQGRIWFGTYEKGLCMHDGEIWYTFTTANSKLCNNYILALETDKDGNVLIGTCFGLSIYKAAQTGIINQTVTRLADKIELLQNYPNPFNSKTKIQYNLSGKGHVKIQIFNIYGQHITTLYDRKQNPGIHSTKWNGQNDYGETVSSGVYFCRVALNGQQEKTIRLVFLK